MPDSLSRVVLAANAKIRFGCKSITAEAPCELRDGLYDVEEIGAYSYIGGFSSVVRHTKSIGRFCSIARNVSIGPTEHPTSFLSSHHIFEGDGQKQLDSEDLRDYVSKNTKIISETRGIWSAQSSEKVVIGNDVWIGEGALVTRGVTIGDGAIIASHALVTKSVEPYTIVGGIPARTIRPRFPKDVIEKLMQLSWTRYGLRALEGARLYDIEQSISTIEKNIARGLEPYQPSVYIISANGITPK
jgi:acetyltransferase-like isoleucine patch superfamily enzyme